MLLICIASHRVPAKCAGDHCGGNKDTLRWDNHAVVKKDPILIFRRIRHNTQQLMRKALTMSIGLALLTVGAFGQQLNDDQEIVALAKFYRTYHGLSGSEDAALIAKYQGTKFEHVAAFIQEAAKPNNRIIEREYLSCPDSATLKIFHTIIRVNYNMYEADPEDNTAVAEAYLSRDVSRHEQISAYYSSLFVSVINKNRPFDYSQRNWALDSLGFKDEKEKSVFFLVFIDKLGSQLSSYLKAMRGPNWTGIEDYAPLLPLINGKPYYQFDEFYFKDFEMNIYKQDRNFKEYYLPIFYDVLVAHLLMLEQKQRPTTEINDLLLTSILSKEQYYKYCRRMDVITSHFTKRD